MLPETNYFTVHIAEREAQLRADKEAQGSDHVAASGLKAFGRVAWKGWKENWFLFCYMVVLMAGFNACSHGSQDFYPTFLKNQVELGESQQ